MKKYLLSVDDDLWKTVKSLAALHEKPIGQIINDLLKDWVDHFLHEKEKNEGAVPSKKKPETPLGASIVTRKTGTTKASSKK